MGVHPIHSYGPLTDRRQRKRRKSDREGDGNAFAGFVSHGDYASQSGQERRERGDHGRQGGYGASANDNAFGARHDRFRERRSNTAYAYDYCPEAPFLAHLISAHDEAVEMCPIKQNEAREGAESYKKTAASPRRRHPGWIVTSTY